MGVSAAVAVGSAVVGSYVASEGAKDAAQTQADATRDAAALQQSTADKQLELQKKMYDEGVARQSPWLEQGKLALAELGQGLRAGGRFNTPFTFNTTGSEIDPSYAWRVQQGQRAMEASAAAQGGLFTGGQMKALQTYGQNQASQEYQAAFQRFQNKQLQDFNMLSGVAGTGNVTGAGLNTLGANNAAGQSGVLGNMATNVANLNTSGAAAIAAGQVGSANAFNNLLGQGVGTYNTWAQMPAVNQWNGATNAQVLGAGSNAGVISDTLGNGYGSGGYFGGE